MQISRDFVRRFKGAINSLCTVSDSSTAVRSSQGRSLIRTMAALLCVAVLAFTPQAHAQTAGSGSIQGVVTDPAGAVIPNAVVTLTEQSTQVTLTTKTSSGGDYAFPNINPGTYTLTVTATNFETYTLTGSILEVGSSIALNARMTVGSTDTKVEVHANGLALQTEDPSFKQTIDKTEIQEMPLNGRTIEGLVQAAGGANGGSVPGDANGSKYPSQTQGISIAGAPGNAISWRLDGGDNNDYMGGGNNPLPFVDAIGQFSVESAALGAEDGNHMGGLVNIVTQSGTNTYHGSAFEFIRNNVINAESFFATNGVFQKDQLHQDQYGGTFGGHIIRDKLFAFAAFQHQFQSQKQALSTAYVPTGGIEIDANGNKVQGPIGNLQGDFSATDSAGSCSQNVATLSDPNTKALLPGNKYATTPTWNPVALAILTQVPLIHQAIDTTNCGKIQYSIPKNDFDNDFDTRVDYSLNKSNTMYARYFLDSEQNPSPYDPTNLLVTTYQGQPEIRYQTLTFGENFVISSNLVNSVHLTGTRRQLARGFNNAAPNMGNFGVKDFQTLPHGFWLGESSSNHGFNAGGGSNLLATIDDNIPVDFSDDVTWIRGKHQIAFGGSILRNQLNVNNGYEDNGQFAFNGTWSGVNDLKHNGDANLDFLQGAMSTFNQSKPQQNALRGWIPTLYVQDTFHASPRLTVTGGLNWEPQFFPTDFFHRGAQFNMTNFVNNVSSKVFPNAPAGLLFYGDPGVRPNFTQNSPWQFNPNFAFTYDLSGTGKTVFRAGVSYAYDQPNFFSQQRVQNDPPYSLLIAPNTTGAMCLTDPWLIQGSAASGTQGCGYLANPSGLNPVPVAGATDVDPFPFNPAGSYPQQMQVIVLPSTYKAPNTVQWTASIQQQLPHGWNFQIFYTGNRTQHLLGSLPLNPNVYIPGNWGPTTATAAFPLGCPGEPESGPAFAAVYGTAPGAGPVAGTPCSINSINKSLGPQNQPIRSVLAMANPTQGNYYSNNASSAGPSLYETNNNAGNYNGVVVTVQHRFSTSFSLLTNYTWSKCLNDWDPQGDISGLQYTNPNNPSQDYGRCGQNQDVRNMLNVSMVLKSAFPIHGFGGYLINNWQLAPLVRLTSGLAVNVTEGQDETFTGDGNDRPNRVPGVNPYNETKIYSAPTNTQYSQRSFLAQGAFSLNTVPGTYGNVSRNSLSGPIYFQNDAEVSRIFPIREKYNLVLRVEAFNVLNHPSWSNPNSGGTNFTGGSYGEITGTSVGARIFQGAVKVNF